MNRATTLIVAAALTATFGIGATTTTAAAVPQTVASHVTAPPDHYSRENAVWYANRFVRWHQKDTGTSRAYTLMMTRGHTRVDGSRQRPMSKAAARRALDRARRNGGVNQALISLAYVAPKDTMMVMYDVNHAMWGRP